MFSLTHAISLLYPLSSLGVSRIKVEKLSWQSLHGGEIFCKDGGGITLGYGDVVADIDHF